MKRRNKQIISWLCSALLLAAPVSAVAGPGVESEVETPVLPSAVIISEVQTGAAAAGDEFVEIVNVSDAAVDITGWQVRYANAGNETTTSLATVAGPDAQPLVLQPGEYYTFHTSSVTINGNGQVYSAGLAKTDKTVALFETDTETCQMIVADAVAWALPTAAATKGEDQPLDPTGVNTKEKLLRRQQEFAGSYIDTNDNSFDFVISEPGSLATPGAANQSVLPEGTVLPEAGVGSVFAPIAIADCVVDPDETEPPVTPPEESPPSVTEPPEGSEDPAPGPPIPAANIGLKSPLLSEFLPNPAPPQTDKDDEFIELYNSNDKTFDLSGYALEVGLKTKRRHTIAAGTKIKPKSFLALFSADTNLALSNSGSVVSLVDPLGRVLATSQAYASAKDGQSWVLSAGKWQWTTKPTPNALNVVSAPAVKSAKTKAASTSRSSGGSNSSQNGGAEEETQNLEAFGAAQSTPLHPGVLALITLSALIYGTYEYRHDMANRIYQFRANRAARREARKGAEGR